MSMTTYGQTGATGPVGVPSLLQLEITGKCQLMCRHCYAGSGPVGTHGSMTDEDWLGVIDQAAALGIRAVQFIGGEPGLHPALSRLVGHAVAAGLDVEVYTNLVRVTPGQWAVFALPGVSLATSWYSDDPSEHAVITGRDTHARTWANITECVGRGIPLRAGVVTGIVPGQRHRQAVEALRALGVPVSTDYVRQLGRGTLPDPAALCGACGGGVACVDPAGDVHPCPMSRWVYAGSVRDGLASALAQVRQAAFDAGLTRVEHVGSRPPCAPDTFCDPNYCNPKCIPSLT
jgi:MoaA/NifB/PqqE/SkfB family radical SAM enzyme